MIGTTVSHYRILEHLGGGGMGVVYKAEDTRLKRTVALKFLPPALTCDSEAKSRFIHEAQAASSLQHNNIGTVHDIDETADGQVFIVMDFYEGETLDNLIKAGRLTVDHAIAIALQVARGLKAAHDKGVVHRDIKPANIMITSDGSAKIIDFGIARLSGCTRVTRAGSTIGTVPYMSPEQVRGEEVDRRSDIWSFGVMLFEMLTGKTPFYSDYDNAVIYSILYEQPKRVRDLRPGVPENVSTLISHCLQKDRNGRPGEMGEVVYLLQGRQPSIWTSPEVWKRFAKPALFVISALFVVVAALLWLVNRSTMQEAPGASDVKWRIAITLLDDQTGETRNENWPALIQALVVDRLTGTEEIGVVDAAGFTLSSTSASVDHGASAKATVYDQMKEAQVSFLVEGTLSRSDTVYLVRWTLTDVASQEVKLAPLERFSDRDGLPRVAEALSGGILSFFRVSSLMSDKEADLRPWLKNRSRNIASLEAFLQGSEYAYRNKSEARKFFEKAIVLDTAFIPPRIWLLSSLLGEGRVDEANRHYQTLVKLDAGANPFEHALIRYSGAALRGDLPAQKLSLHEALEYSPRNQTLLYLLGRVCYDRNDFEGAAEAFQPLVDMNWRYQGAYYMLGVCYSQLKRFKEAKSTLERSLPLEPVYLHTYALMAALDLHEGDSSGSARNARKYLETGDEHAHPRDTLLFWLGNCYSLCNLQQSALDCYRQVVNLDPLGARYHFELGRTYYAVGWIDSAETELMRTLALDPSLFEAHLSLGRVYDFSNDSTKALHHYAAYIACDSASLDAREAQRRVTELARVTHP